MAIENRVHARCGCGFSHAAESAENVRHSGTRPFAFAASPRHYERDRPFFIRHLALDATLDLEKKTLTGKATLTIERLDPEATEIELDALAFDLASVTIGGKKAEHSYDGRILTVHVGAKEKKATIAVEYTVTPRRGLYFLEPDDQVRDRPRQVWSQCQEEDARHFIPCHDKPHVKMTTEMRVHVPRGFYVLSNGELVSKETPKTGALWTYHWKMNDPHPSYLLTLVAGEFAEITATTAGKVPLSYLVPKDRKKDGERTFLRTPEMVDYFGKVTGVPFPWNKYAQVVVSDFIFGGMENTTATTMYEHILLDERAALDVSSDDLIAHELAHQWFGDYVTCRDWSEGWLNEGFATFFEHVWREHHLGRDEYELGVKNDLDSYLGEASGRYRRAIVTTTYDSPLDLFDRHLYEKGGLVLHTLRMELGDELFWRGINLYLTRNGRGSVETRDLMRALEEVSGRSLGQHFDQFVFRPGHPEIEVGISWNRGVLTVNAKQSQSTADEVPNVFEVPIELAIVDEKGKVRTEVLTMKQRVDSFAIPVAQRPAFVVVDPKMRILGDVSAKAPNDMLRAQLEKAPTARGRWLAAHALAKSDDAPTIAALAARLADEKEFWGVRAAVAEALGGMRNAAAQTALEKGLGSKHPKVRRASAGALGGFKNRRASDALKKKALHDESYLVESEATRSLGRTKESSGFDTIVEALDRASWADVVRVAAIDGLAALRDDRAAPHVLAGLKYGQPTRARRASVMAVPKLMTDRKGREALEDLLDDSDPHLRIDVARALVEYGDVKARGALHERLSVDLDPRVRRRIRESLRDLGGDSKRAVDGIREELDKVSTEASELRARIVQLEARTAGGKSGDKSRDKKNGDKKAAEKPTKQGEKRSGKSKKKSK